jgi:hypothetical protein
MMYKIYSAYKSTIKKGVQIFCSLVKNSLYQCSLYRGETVYVKSLAYVKSL